MEEAVSPLLLACADISQKGAKMVSSRLDTGRGTGSEILASLALSGRLFHVESDQRAAVHLRDSHELIASRELRSGFDLLQFSTAEDRSLDLMPRRSAASSRVRRRFLAAQSGAANIVTNPPYNCAEGFVASGVRYAKRKFALLIRLAFLEGANRARTIFTNSPPSRVWVFSERITFYPSGVEPKSSGTTAYAWFVLDKEAAGSTELKWFKPG